MTGRRWSEPTLKPHGTIAAHRRHYRRGELPCESCRQAACRNAADYRERRLKAAAEAAGGAS